MADLKHRMISVCLLLFGIVIAIVSLYKENFKISNSPLKSDTDNQLMGKPTEPSFADAISSSETYPLRVNEYGTCTKGKGISRQWLREEFARFIRVYDQRPKTRNTYGTKLMHQFGLWATIR